MSSIQGWAPVSGDSSPSAAPGKTEQKSDGMVNKETFLQLLVAQLKNQNPLSPADGVQFLAQLAQFSQLEQTMNMSQDLREIRDAIKTPAVSGDAT